jgi:hypothetical protein
VSPLFREAQSNSRSALSGVFISGDERASYILRTELERRFSAIHWRMNELVVKIHLKNSISQSVYCTAGVVKELSSVSAFVKVFDKSGVYLGGSCFNSVANYEMNESSHFSNLSSERMALEVSVKEIANSIFLFIVSFLNDLTPMD